MTHSQCVALSNSEGNSCQKGAAELLDSGTYGSQRCTLVNCSCLPDLTAFDVEAAIGAEVQSFTLGCLLDEDVRYASQIFNTPMGTQTPQKYKLTPMPSQHDSNLLPGTGLVNVPHSTYGSSALSS